MRNRLGKRECCAELGRRTVWWGACVSPDDGLAGRGAGRKIAGRDKRNVGFRLEISRLSRSAGCCRRAGGRIVVIARGRRSLPVRWASIQALLAVYWSEQWMAWLSI